MKPEEGMLLPLAQDTQDPYCICDAEGVRVAAARFTTREAAALVTMCNSYPLALALAEAAQGLDSSPDAEAELARALSAFLAHRNTEAKP